MKDSNSKIWIAEDEGQTPVGQLRVDNEKEGPVFSIIVAPEFQGKGYGTDMIRMAAGKTFEDSTLKTIHAYVKPDNPASDRAFMNAGFQQNGKVEVKGHECLHYLLNRSRYESLS